jgi:hypothetical protein
LISNLFVCEWQLQDVIMSQKEIWTRKYTPIVWVINYQITFTLQCWSTYLTKVQHAWSTKTMGCHRWKHFDITLLSTIDPFKGWPTKEQTLTSHHRQTYVPNPSWTSTLTHETNMSSDDSPMQELEHKQPYSLIFTLCPVHTPIIHSGVRQGWDSALEFHNLSQY